TPLSSGSMSGRSMAVRKVPGVSQRTRRPKMISTFSGRPRSRLSAISASKNDRARCGASKTTVRETSTCRIEHSHQYPASRSVLPNGIGIRCSHRWANTSMVPGLQPVADLLQPGRVIAGREAVGQLGEGDAGLGCLPLGPLVPVDPDLGRVREVGADLDE